MPRFRLLTEAELQELAMEFKQFLIINQIYDKEWRELAQNDPDKAQEFISLFSDIVLEKSYQKAQFLYQVGQDFITLFWLQDKEWQLLHFSFEGISLPENLNVDQLFGFLQSKLSESKIKKGTKPAPLQKAEQVHQMIQNGAQILSPAIGKAFHELFALLGA